MAATSLSSIIAEVRDFLVEATARFWTDAELQAIMVHGIHDLWGAILDLHAEHYIVINDRDVCLRANQSVISGVPDNCFRVQLIEPMNISSSGSGRQIKFIPRKFKDPDFASARAMDATDPSSAGIIYFHVTGVGSPLEAPRILTAPLLTADLRLRISYNPTLTVNNNNPVPGESNNALKAWTIAHAMAKEAEGAERVPNPSWLSIYATEKQSILVRLTPRQEQEPDVVEDFFHGYGSF